ncbi:deoxycytidine triphosphate deaminase [Nitrosomonas ureae]|uniref:Deoxycytidine triphosphate deaminase n=1 Tax=Nitrosomonas ureae TaxID=44577 RepID=A0A285BU19_9PROT|nr:deoxycytidine deaminase [Nitrosomonas ureae]SNX58744.1 deoxycytidine triphosphate deaminase [Nitrosomonas ureae]
MIVIEKNLEYLAAQYSICDKSLVDDYSLKIQMGSFYYEPCDSKHESTIVYGHSPDPASLFSQKKEIAQNLSLPPGFHVIACSKHQYKIPLDYLGLVQTKGTLARLFVQATCNDGQVEPGFHGYITLEILNMSRWTVEIPEASDIAQMYLIKCSSPALQPYHGRYATQSKEGPTVAIFKK